jgi:signal transduction histidine kinase/CheY-like chemotaxis protein
MLFEEAVFSPDGHKRIFETIKAPIRDEQGEVQGLIGVSRDITVQREMENRLREASANETLLRIAGSIAHDLNNALSPVMGYAELAQRHATPGSPQLRYLANICDSVRIATGLTARLQAFGQKLFIKPVDLDLADFVARIMPDLQRVAGRKVKLSFSAHSKLPLAKADPTYLRNAFEALAENAQDFLPEGSEMRIEISEVKAAPPDGQPMLCIRVSDNGPGMRPEVASKAFEPFFTTKNFGSGLGLSMVLGLFKQHGGSVELRTSPGKGVALDLYLPAGDAVSPANSVILEHARIRVLVVDDEPLVMKLVSDLLSMKNFQVVTAGSAAEAIHLAEGADAPFNLLITDAALDKMSGYELYALLAQKNPELRCVVMSGFSQGTLNRNLNGAKETAFLQKPFSMGGLLTAVASALGELD